MSRAVTGLVSRGTLLAYRSSLQTERHQMNLMFKRTNYSKAVSKPAPYLTREVILNKLMEFAPGWAALTALFLGCKFYLMFNGLNFSEIKNYYCTYPPKPKNTMIED